MEARVKEKSRISTVTAGGGQYFVKPEWSHVEAGTEAEIKASEFLDVRKDSVAVDESKSKAKRETQAKPKPLPDPPKPSAAIKGSSGDNG